MLWNEVKQAYPSQWLIIEAIDAKTISDKRIIEQVSVVDTFHDDSQKALLKYVELHKTHKDREFYVVHTERPELDIEILRWSGVRPGCL